MTKNKEREREGEGVLENLKKKGMRDGGKKKNRRRLWRPVDKKYTKWW